MMRRTLRIGVLTGIGMSFVGAIGMVGAFNGRELIAPILSLGYLVLFGMPALGGWLAGRPDPRIPGNPPPPPWWVGAVVGAVGGVIAAAFALLIRAVDFTEFFPKLSPALSDLYAFGQPLGAGLVLMVVAATVAALAGSSFRELPPSVTKGLGSALQWVFVFAIFEPVVKDLFRWLRPVLRFLYAPRGGLSIAGAVIIGAIAWYAALRFAGSGAKLRERFAAPDQARRTATSLWLAGIVLVVLIIIPQLLGGVLNELLTNVGLFLLMALGLNIVVGLAGLLDLGYVAFFAVGAYSTAVLTSPISPRWDPQIGFWLALPVALVLGMVAGLLVGTPVIRMRGDYLAIVTLGFGEIVRVLLLSDWLSGYFGGAQGVRNIPGIPVLGTEINGADPNIFVYFVVVFVALAAYVSWRVQNSRVGRAWAAMREDEDVAEAIGINTVQAKLLAFITGAVLASLGGALFAVKVGSVFTNSFDVLVSIIILVVVIVGGMGSLPGVTVGALVLIGILGGPKQPGLLQEFQEFKLLIYGALLVLMMLVKPEGLIPSVRRSRELHQEEFLQDAWLDKGTAAVEPEQEAAV